MRRPASAEFSSSAARTRRRSSRLVGFVCGAGERERRAHERAARARIGRELAEEREPGLEEATWLRRTLARAWSWWRRELLVLREQRAFDERLWLAAPGGRSARST